MQALEPLLEKLEPDSWACFNKYVKSFNLIMFCPFNVANGQTFETLIFECVFRINVWSMRSPVWMSSILSLLEASLR